MLYHVVPCCITVHIVLDSLLYRICFFSIVLIRFVVVMGQVGPVKRSPGRVHDLRDAHSCMKKKCLEMPEALPTCGTTHSMAVPPYTSDHVRYVAFVKQRSFEMLRVSGPRCVIGSRLKREAGWAARQHGNCRLFLAQRNFISHSSHSSHFSGMF